MMELEPEELAVLARFREKGEVALAAFFDEHRTDLQRLIRLRLDRRISRRVDDSDIIQEAFVESCNRLATYLESPQIPPTAWIRRLARQVVVRVQRSHLSTQKRDVRREAYGTPLMPLDLFELSAAISPPNARIERVEMQEQIVAMLDSMTPLEREILVLVHAEELTVREAAAEIGIGLEAAKKRYRRALNRLRNLTNWLVDSSA